MKITNTLIIALVSFNAYAGWSSTSGEVSKITSHNGHVLIETGITDGPCGNGAGFYWPTSDDDSQIMVTLALTAQTTGKNIKVVYDQSTPNCLFDKAKITHMTLLNE